jgi:hypothetical protein
MRFSRNWRSYQAIPQLRRASPQPSRLALPRFSLDNEGDDACQSDRLGEFCAHPRVRVAERFSRRASATLDRVEWLAGDVVAAPAGAVRAQDAGGSE